MAGEKVFFKISDTSTLKFDIQSGNKVNFKVEEHNLDFKIEENKLNFKVTGGIATSSESGGSATDANSIIFEVSQTAHGLTKPSPVYFDGTEWKLAQANDSNTMAEGLIYEVVDNDNFKVIYNGIINSSVVLWDSITGLTGGLVAGENYLLSISNKGMIVSDSVQLTGNSQYIIKALSTTKALVILNKYNESSTNYIRGNAEDVEVLAQWSR